jgi:hypothetical protein
MQTAQMLKAKREERAAALDKVKALSSKIEGFEAVNDGLLPPDVLLSSIIMLSAMISVR